MYPIVNSVPKVLIIEDNKDTSKNEQKTAEKMGFETRIIESGSTAIEEIRNYKPNIIILDLELPGKTGVQIQEEMLNDFTLKDIPIIVESVHLKDSPDPNNLGNQYERVYASHTGKRPVHTVRGASTKDLIIELTIACGELEGKLPQKLMDYWLERDAHKVRFFEAYG